jgi:crossover junction endodeoxyribonuclease RuvC
MQNKNNPKTRVLAVDPGYNRLGIAVLEKNNNCLNLLFSNCFEIPRKSHNAERLFLVKKEIDKTMDEFSPDWLAIEDIFLNKNKKTVIMVAQARGVVLALSAEKQIPVYEINPLRVKVAVTGYGRSPKNDVFNMVKKLIDLPNRKMLDDEIDAIAIGITFLVEYRKS